jgi:hypothetical protein
MHSTQLVSVSISNSENGQKRSEFGTVRLSDYFACGHISLSVEFVASCAAAMQFLSETGRCGEPAANRLKAAGRRPPPRGQPAARASIINKGGE